MKTPMQQAIEKFEHALSYNVEGGLVEPYSWTDFSNDLHELLEEEKREIMDAWNDGFYGLEAPETQSAEQYYNQTYNNENKQDTVQ